MHYVGTRHPLAAANPLRSMPLFRPAASLVRAAPQPLCAPVSLAEDPDWSPRAPVAPTTRILDERELRNAEAALLDVQRAYAAARTGIGEANRRSLPETLPAFIRRQVGPFVPVVLSADQVRARKSAAFSLFNKRRGELTRARRRVDAARAALAQPSLAFTVEQVAVAIVVRTSKQRPVVHHAPVASTVAA